MLQSALDGAAAVTWTNVAGVEVEGRLPLSDLRALGHRVLSTVTDADPALPMLLQ